ncbi:MAG: poly(R)-hydroxyalkanoic acid synthase subunit PhaE [Halobacteriales archaeon]|nr:poly(R)-hydroxyalkanoic acid synthase subunit PhaE [Halobacteriales archaeon]
MTDDARGFFADSTEAALDAIEHNVELHAAATEALLDAFDADGDSDGEAEYEDAVEGYARMYETWMNASTDALERYESAFAGEDVGVEDFREIWLEAANEAFKDVMTTSAFAAATGETVGTALDIKEEMDESANRTLGEMGFATSRDVEEIGERLVELERRQHAVENKLDEILQRV